MAKTRRRIGIDATMTTIDRPLRSPPPPPFVAKSVVTAPGQNRRFIGIGPMPQVQPQQPGCTPVT